MFCGHSFCDRKAVLLERKNKSKLSSNFHRECFFSPQLQDINSINCWKLLLSLSPRLWKCSHENVAKKGKFQASMQFHQIWLCPQSYSYPSVIPKPGIKLCVPPLDRPQRCCEEVSPMFPIGPPGCQQGTNTALQESGKSGETWGADPFRVQKKSFICDPWWGWRLLVLWEYWQISVKIYSPYATRCTNTGKDFVPSWSQQANLRYNKTNSHPKRRWKKEFLQATNTLTLEVSHCKCLDWKQLKISHLS